MRVLVADDDRTTRRLLAALVRRRGHDCVEVADGTEAWDVLGGANEPVLALLDWVMPGLEGPEVCRLARQHPASAGSYLILVSSRDRPDDVMEALAAGADDHVAKPFHPGELAARLGAGERVLGLQARLRERITELERAHARIRGLENLLAVCAHCRRVRSEQGRWETLEARLEAGGGGCVTHGICPECLDAVLEADRVR